MQFTLIIGNCNAQIAKYENDYELELMVGK